MQAHERTTGRLLGQANHEMWAEEVVHNLPVVSPCFSTLDLNCHSCIVMSDFCRIQHAALMYSALKASSK